MSPIIQITALVLQVIHQKTQLIKWNEAKAKSPLFKNATIRGSWGDVDYAGEIRIKGGNLWNTGLTIFGDTRFSILRLGVQTKITTSCIAITTI